MNPKTAIVLNIAAVIAWVWVGSYAQEKLDGTWAQFPAFATAFLMGTISLFAAGVMAAVWIDPTERRDHERE